MYSAIALAALVGRPDWNGGPGEALPPVEVVSYRNNRVELKVESPRPTFMVTSEGYYPGWRASLWLAHSSNPVHTNK